MDEIKHSFIDVRGLSLHIAEIGNADAEVVVVLLHGFPEIWYAWRHQMVAAARAGYRAIAPDFRGHGLSDRPAEIEEDCAWSDHVADVLGILDRLAIPKAFLVAKDWGIGVSNRLALQHPERVSGMVTIGAAYSPHRLSLELLPEGFYIRRWQEPGRAEEDFGRRDVKAAIRNIYILFSGSELPIAEEDQEVMDLVDPEAPLPPWFSEEDLAIYASSYEKSGFSFPLQTPYRERHEDLKVEDPVIRVPALLIMGEKDYFLKFPGIEDYIKSGKAKEYAPDLDVEFITEGTHFVQEQFPDQVNQLIITFMKRRHA